MLFDNIIGNPPFQDSVNRGKTQHKVWINFTINSFYNLLKDNGNLGWITPSSFSSPSNKVLNIFRDYNVKYLNLDTSQYFPDVGSTFSHYLINKSKLDELTQVQKNNKSFDVKLDNNSFYLPVDFSNKSYNIHQKVIFNTSFKLDVQKDYVTCHNILLKKSDTLSKIKTKKHIYPVFHTNNQVWYSSVKQDFLESKKVMWTRSGYTKPFYDDGTMGCTDMGYYILVDNKEEGENLQHNLNSVLFKYILTTAKWSGFGNEKVFSSLPMLPNNKKLSDSEIYEMFEVTDDEIKYIESYGNKKISKKKGITKIVNSTQRVKQLGEVFTPKELVIKILSLIPKKEYIDNNTFLDPTCGDGAFLVEVVKMKMGSEISVKDILKTLYGVDIMEDNVLRTKQNILNVVGDTKSHRKILDKNILCKNGMEYDYSFKDKFW